MEPVEFEQHIKKLESEFGAKVQKLADNRIQLVVDPEKLPEAAKYIFEKMSARYGTMVATDERDIIGKFSITHIFVIEAGDRGYVVSLRAEIDPRNPEYPSITPVIPAANFAEREGKDLIGVVPKGHPDPRRLILPDDFPEGVYPGRREFRYDRKDVVTEEMEYPFKPVPRESVAEMVVGPYHLALHEPEQFRLYVEGEKVVDADYRGFYVFRGIEKLAESRLNINQIPFIAERICGICGFAHAVSYANALESALKVEVPDRARYIRTILLEIERIHSHLLFIGVACHLAGFDTGFMQTWRIREAVMQLAEYLTGNRKTYGQVIPGGVRRDISRDHIDKVRSVVKRVREDFKEFVDALLGVTSLRRRCEGIGLLPPDKARELGALGPVARGSGLPYDTRKSLKYEAYGELPFKVVTLDGCDVWSRILVRVYEVFESIDIIEHAVDKLPGGHIKADIRDWEPYRIGTGHVEAPRGETLHYVMTWFNARVYRWRVRAPTYNNLLPALYMVVGYTVADAPLIIGSIDPCFSCTDRVVIIDKSSGKFRVLSGKEFVMLARKGSR